MRVSLDHCYNSSSALSRIIETIQTLVSLACVRNSLGKCLKLLLSVDVVGMISKGEIIRGASYIALNNFGAITAGLLGFKFAAKVMGR